MAAPFSNLEVASSSNLEVDKKNDQPGLEHDPTKPNPTQRHLDSHKQAYDSTPLRNRRICRLAPRTFWIVVAVGIVVVIAIVVGVAVSVTNSNSQVFEQPPSDSPTPDLPTPSLTTTPALTTTQIDGPSYTLLRDCPSSNNTLYGVTLGSTSMSFRKVCGMSYLNTQGISGSISVKTSSLDSCINSCATYNAQNASAIASGQNSVCNAVCWRNSLANDDQPGTCFGFTTQNSTNAFVIKAEAECDSAAWINQKLL